VDAKQIVGETLDLLLRHGDVVAVTCFAAALLLLTMTIADAVLHHRRRRRQRRQAAATAKTAKPSEASAEARPPRGGIVTAIPARARPLSPETRREPMLIVPSRRTEGASRTRPPPAVTAH
jgi:hypothetical protein